MKRIAAMSLVALLGACAGSSQDSKGSNPYDDMPDWISRGSGVYPGDEGNAFYGVGVSSLERPDRRMRDATLKARAALAQAVQTNIKTMTRAFDETIVSDGKESNESLLEEVTRVLSTMELRNSNVVERYYNSELGTEYALVRMTAKDLVEAVESMPLDAQTRDLVRENAEGAFARLPSGSGSGE